MPTTPLPTLILILCCLPLSRSWETCREPLLRYSFTPEQCANSIIQNEGTKLTPADIVFVGGKTKCAPSLGIETTGSLSSVGVISKDRIGDMMNEINLNGEGISIAVFFKPFLGSRDMAIRPLLTIGKLKEFENHAPAPSGTNRCDSHEFDLQIAQRAGRIEIFFRANAKLFERCQHYRIESLLPPEKMAHLVVSLKDGHQQAFLNGTPGPLLSEPFPENISHWRSSAHLYMLSNPFVDQSQWLGMLYQLSIFSGSLGPSEVLGCLRSGLPQTSPHGFDYSVTMNEDAADVALSLSRECFAGESSDLGAEEIKLRVGSIDEEIRQLKEETGAMAQTTANHRHYVYVTRLPALGRLFQFDGTPIESQLNGASLPVLVSSEDSTVKYVPPQNAHSGEAGIVFDGFSYCVAAKPLINIRMCSPGNVDIYVRAVNDAPVALKVRPVLITEGPASSSAPKIRLAGYDADDDMLQNIQITQAPRHGRLSLGVYSFRKDSLRHGTAISDLNYTVKADDPVYVEYVWGPDPILPVVGDHPSRDEFLFRVTDSRGCWSAEEKIEVVIQSALLAYASPSTTAEASPGTSVSLTWLANDQSGVHRELAFYVVSVPSYDIGLLIDPETQSRVQPGSLVRSSSRQFHNQSTSTVTFRASEEACGPYRSGAYPSHAEVVVQSVALDHDAVVSASNSVPQTIRLSCDNDTLLTMAVPATQTVMDALTLRRAADLDCLQSIFQKTRQQRQTCGTSFHGIVFEQRRAGTEEVRVTVSSRAGCISFEDSAWRHVKLLSGRRALASGATSFLADERDLTDIFSGMTFQSFAEGSDFLEIRVLIGECLLLGTVEGSSCIELVEVMPLVLQQDVNLASRRLPQPRFPWHVVLCFLGYPALYYLLRKVESPRHNSE